MRRRRLGPGPSEMPSRLRAFHPVDWPDPPDWADDAGLVAAQTRTWSAMPDGAARLAWWASADPVYRSRLRWSSARLAWCDEHGVDFLDVLAEDRAYRLAAARRAGEEGRQW